MMVLDCNAIGWVAVGWPSSVTGAETRVPASCCKQSAPAVAALEIRDAVVVVADATLFSGIRERCTTTDNVTRFE